MNISIILAAGEGTRMKSKYSKVLHKISNKPILEYVIDASKGAEFEKNIVIVGDNENQVKEKFKGQDLIFKKQNIGEDFPYGTGYAVMQAVDEIDDLDTVLILYGDTPLIRPETISGFMDYHEKNSLDGTVLTSIIEDPFGYGRIIREQDGSILKIVEEKDASSQEKKVQEVNSGIYIFKGGLLKEALGEINNNNAQNEYYITDVIEILKDKGYKLGGCLVEDARDILGVNSRVQLAQCEAIMRSRTNDYHMSQGVTLIDPDRTYIDPSVEIGRDTIIYPGVQLEGTSKIGEDCIIKGNSRIYNSRISNNVSIQDSIIEESTVEENTNLGPYTHIRPNSKIGSNVKLGNFVEVKNSSLGDNTKASHLSYIGDSDLGENINVGCGVVFVNYDGKNKFRSSVGDNSFIGCNANIVSPVTIGSDSFIAAGSTITEDVASGDLAIARSRQTNKKDWTKKK